MVNLLMKKKEKVTKVEVISPKTNNSDNLSKTLILGLVGLVLLLIPGTLNKLIGIYSVLGIIIIIYPYSIINLVTICLGVYLLINGLLKIKVAINLKNITNKWIGTLVMGIVTIILGILLIFNPFAGITITKLAGAFLVIVAIFDLVDTYVIQK